MKPYNKGLHSLIPPSYNRKENCQFGVFRLKEEGVYKRELVSIPQCKVLMKFQPIAVLHITALKNLRKLSVCIELKVNSSKINCKDDIPKRNRFPRRYIVVAYWIGFTISASGNDIPSGSFSLSGEKSIVSPVCCSFQDVIKKGSTY